MSPSYFVRFPTLDLMPPGHPSGLLPYMRLYKERPTPAPKPKEKWGASIRIPIDSSGPGNRQGITILANSNSNEWIQTAYNNRLFKNDANYKIARAFGDSASSLADPSNN